MAEEEQTTGAAQQILYGPTDATRYGQRLTISNRSVTKLAFKAEIDQGSPTGDLTFTIRKVSNDAVLLTKVWADASTIVSGAWMEVTFDSPATVNEEVRIQVEYAGGDISNRIAVYGTTPSVKASEYAGRYLSAAYNDQVTWDAVYRYTYSGVSTTPTVTTQANTNTIAISSTGNGTIVDTGGAAITQHGHVWATTQTPDTSDNKTELGAAPQLGPFTSLMTSLVQGTTYYVRAYAINGNGTAYGAQVSIGTDSTIGKRYVWTEGQEFHYFDENGAERVLIGEGVGGAAAIHWWLNL